MDLIVVDDDVCNRYREEVLINKFENFERVEEVYLGLSKGYLELRIQQYSNEVTVIVRKSIDVMEAGEEFFYGIRKYLTGFVNDFFELNRVTRGASGVMEVMYKDGSVKIEEFLEMNQSKYRKIVEDTIRMVEEKQDQLIEKRFECENFYADFKRKYSQDFKNCCYWMLEKGFLAIIKEEVKFLEWFYYVLMTIEYVLNDLEYIKFSVIGKVFEVIKGKFCVDFENKEFSAQNFGYVHRFEGGGLCEGSKEFLVYSGIVFFRLKLQDPQIGVFLVYTLDNYLHFFKDKSDTSAFLMVSLKEFKYRFYSEESEYYLEIFKEKIRYLVRFKNNPNFQEWKRVLTESF